MEPLEEQLEIVVTPDKQPERLDVFVTRAVRGMTRSRAKRLIDEQKILVDGIPVKAGHLVAPDERIAISYPVFRPMNAAPEDLPLTILYEDDDLVVINKQPGIIIHPSVHTPNGTVVNGLVHHIGRLSSVNGPTRPGIVHRLDKDTTGVLVVSKTDQAHRILSDQFMYRQMQKTYWAFLSGRLRQTEGTIDRPLARGRADIRRMVITPQGKPSVTEYRVLQQYAVAALVELYPRTGRTHQIRAHMASIGHPCVGDQLYGGGTPPGTCRSRAERTLFDTLLTLISRQALHAHALGFTHPADGRWCHFEAPMPADMQAVQRCLEASNSPGTDIAPMPALPGREPQPAQ